MVRITRGRWPKAAGGTTALLLAALALPAQSLDAVAKAYRDKPTARNHAALERFARAHRKDAQGPLALLALGVIESEQKEYAQAIDHLRAAQSRLPRLADYIAYYLASAQLESHNAAAALQELERFWNSTPRSPLAGHAALLAARAHWETGQPQEAIRILKQHYDQLPQPAGDLSLAANLEKAGDLPASAGRYQRVFYGYPASKEADDAATGLDRLRAALAANFPPPLPEAMLERAGKWLAAGNHRRARSEFESLVSTLGGAEREIARVRLGVADYQAGRTTTACAYLRGLELSAPEADAERLYQLVECARHANGDAEMMDAVEKLSRHPDSPWRLRALISAGNRHLLDNRAEAYVPLYRACYESFPDAEEATNCHWKVTWSAYLRRQDDAAALLRAHLERYPGSEKASAALYFLGRLAEAGEDPEAARAWYQKIVERFPNHYYAGLAQGRLARLPRVTPSPVVTQFLAGIAVPPPNLPDAFTPTAASQARLERARLLDSAGFEDLAENELRFGAANDGQPHLLAMHLAQLAADRGAPDRGMRYLKKLAPGYFSLPLDSAPPQFWRLLFPLPFRSHLERYSRSQGLDPHLIAGLVRQESEFNPKAISPARAYGLTQIRPLTGRQIFRQLKLGRFTTGKLFRPDINLRLGTYYFRTQLEQLGGSLEQTLAAYNAGKSRVEAWREWAAYREPAEFIETIPFSETRNYVFSVLRNAELYRRLYGAGAAGVTSSHGSAGKKVAGGARAHRPAAAAVP